MNIKSVVVVGASVLFCAGVAFAATESAMIKEKNVQVIAGGNPSPITLEGTAPSSFKSFEVFCDSKPVADVTAAIAAPNSSQLHISAAKNAASAANCQIHGKSAAGASTVIGGNFSVVSPSAAANQAMDSARAAMKSADHETSKALSESAKTLDAAAAASKTN